MDPQCDTYHDDTIEDQIWKNISSIDPRNFEEVEYNNNSILEILEFPVHFNYSNGLVQEIFFHKADQEWSENIKRGILNMLNVNIGAGYDQKSKDGENFETLEVNVSFFWKYVTLGKLFKNSEICWWNLILQNFCELTWNVPQKNGVL